MNEIINLKTWFIKNLFLLLLGCTVAMGRIIYVDAGANGLNDGSCWANAYVYLQEALADANAAEKPVEIRVAMGVYKPNQGLVAIPEFDWRTATFQLINGVTLKGGYAGLGQPDPNARDIELYQTILSGDLNGDDIEVADPCDLQDEPTRAENSYHVITGSDIDETAILDGFNITGGYAPGPISVDEHPDKYRFWRGGGMYNFQSSPTLTNCTFSGNFAKDVGGGMANSFFSSPTLINCTFSENDALRPASWPLPPWLGEGGGMYNEESNPILTNCTFSGNSAGLAGGGMLNLESNPILTNCTFSGNQVMCEGGGGMSNLSSNPTLKKCCFSKNSAIRGGGMNNWYSNPTLTNCNFSGNSVIRGGGVGNWYSSPTLNNCTFSENSARAAGGIWNYISDPTLINCTFALNSAQNGNALVCDSWEPEKKYTSNVELTNCILWDGGNEIWNNDNSTIVISYSDIQDGWLGEGNIDADPLFADPNNGDYQLKSQAGRWDPTSGSWLIDNVTSPCIDAGDPNSSVGDEPVPNGGIINMGAYGGTAEVSKSP